MITYEVYLQAEDRKNTTVGKFVKKGSRKTQVGTRPMASSKYTHDVTGGRQTVYQPGDDLEMRERTWPFNRFLR